jgi:putative transcriptional regulator
LNVAKKISRRALAKLEANRDVWQEALDGAREIKAGGGKRSVVVSRSPIVRARLKAGLTQRQFAALLGVSTRTLEQWEQGRRKPSRAAKTLIKVAELHPEVLRKIAA